MTSSNQRLRECVRLVAFYQRAHTSGSQVVTKEGLHIVLTENCCEMNWPGCFSHDQGNSECPTQLLSLGLCQHKRSKTCTNKGPETKFPEIFDELFARANSDDKVCMTNETSKDICYKKKTNKQLTKCSYLHKQIRFATENLLVCIGLWALQCHRQASQYTK